MLHVNTVRSVIVYVNIQLSYMILVFVILVVKKNITMK